jgi:hypothetical protein
MTEPLIAIEVNCATGETIERPFTAEEIAMQEADTLAWAERKAQEEAEATKLADLKASAKAKLIAGAALTEEEASVLVI